MQLKLSSDHKASPLKEIINIFFIWMNVTYWYSVPFKFHFLLSESNCQVIFRVSDNEAYNIFIIFCSCRHCISTYISISQKKHFITIIPFLCFPNNLFQSKIRLTCSSIKRCLFFIFLISYRANGNGLPGIPLVSSKTWNCNYYSFCFTSCIGWSKNQFCGVNSGFVL